MLHIIGDIDLTEGYFDKGLGIGELSCRQKRGSVRIPFPEGRRFVDREF